MLKDIFLYFLLKKAYLKLTSLCRKNPHLVDLPTKPSKSRPAQFKKKILVECNDPKIENCIFLNTSSKLYNSIFMFELLKPQNTNKSMKSSHRK